MGAHRNNPMASGYTGPRPEAIIGANAQAAVEPTEAWKEKNVPVIEAAKAAGVDKELVLHMDDADREVVIRVAVVYVIPLRTVMQKDWPHVTVPATELRIPLLDLKRMVKDALLKDNPALAELVKMPEDEIPRVMS
jgi:hypothetical protein